MNVTTCMIENYKQQKISVLRTITPKWAYGIHNSHTIDAALKSEKGEYEFFIIKTIDLIQNADFGEVNVARLFGESILNDQRICRLLFRWQNGFFVDPPIIVINSFNKTQLSFLDGRHRSKLAFHLSAEFMPIAVHFLDVKDVAKIISLTDINQRGN